MIVYILIGVALLVAVILLLAATKPADFQIERSIEIGAPPERAFALANDFHNWSAWSPWEKLDPELKRSYAGAAAGSGAIYSWVGNKKVGEGRMTIEKSEPSTRIEIKLEFMAPWTATNQAIFSFVPTPSGSRMTWAMNGQRAFGMKLFSLFMDMDKLVGADFEKGLASLKTLAEAPTQGGS